MVIWGWILLAAVVVYLGAMAIASVKVVPEGKMGVILGAGKPRRLLTRGVHLVFPIGSSLMLIPKGPERIMGNVKEAVTRDGWRLSATVQLNAHVVDEQLAALETEDWRRDTLDTVVQVVKTELENNDAIDLRPRPHALDEGCREETDLLTLRYGVHVDWLRVTIRWAHASPPASTPASYALKAEQAQLSAPAPEAMVGGEWESIPGGNVPYRRPGP